MTNEVVDKSWQELAREAQLEREEFRCKVVEQSAEIERLQAIVLQVKQARLDWAMVCECQCAACEAFSNAIRLIGRGAVEPTSHEPLCSPSQAEQRWSLLTKILDESVETMELPSGLHEAFQLGGDAMAEWLDRKRSATANWNTSRNCNGWDCWTCGAFVTHKMDAAEVERDCLKCGPASRT